MEAKSAWLIIIIIIVHHSTRFASRAWRGSHDGRRRWNAWHQGVAAPSSSVDGNENQIKTMMMMIKPRDIVQTYLDNVSS